MRPPHHRRPTDHTQRQGVVGAPTKEDVDAAHAQFIAALTKLFDEHTAQYGYATRTLAVP